MRSCAEGENRGCVNCELSACVCLCVCVCVCVCAAELMLTLAKRPFVFRGAPPTAQCDWSAQSVSSALIGPLSL